MELYEAYGRRWYVDADDGSVYDESGELADDEDLAEANAEHEIELLRTEKAISDELAGVMIGLHVQTGEGMRDLFKKLSPTGQIEEHGHGQSTLGETDYVRHRGRVNSARVGGESATEFDPELRRREVATRMENDADVARDDREAQELSELTAIDEGTE